jgi:hypothetical protein
MLRVSARSGDRSHAEPVSPATLRRRGGGDDPDDAHLGPGGAQCRYARRAPHYRNRMPGTVSLRQGSLCEPVGEADRFQRRTRETSSPLRRLAGWRSRSLYAQPMAGAYVPSSGRSRWKDARVACRGRPVAAQVYPALPARGGCASAGLRCPADVASSSQAPSRLALTGHPAARIDRWCSTSEGEPATHPCMPRATCLGWRDRRGERRRLRRAFSSVAALTCAGTL